MKIIAIVPARMASSRFPGKPMKPIHGIPMIGHCYIRTSMSKLLTDCYVATPDRSIDDYIKSIGGDSVMTSHKHKMCHDRVVEAVLKLETFKISTITTLYLYLLIVSHQVQYLAYHLVS